MEPHEISGSKLPFSATKLRQSVPVKRLKTTTDELRRGKDAERKSVTPTEKVAYGANSYPYLSAIRRPCGLLFHELLKKSLMALRSRKAVTLHPKERGSARR